jgi:transcription elongation factor GreA
MNGIQAVMLTPEGWRQLHDELALFEQRRAEAAVLPHDESGAGPEIVAFDQRIEELQRLLLRAVPVDRTTLAPDLVGIGSCVTVRWADGEEEVFTLVGPPESAPRTGRISYESPVGRALIGRRIGEHVTVATAGGPTQIEVVTVGQNAGIA